MLGSAYSSRTKPYSAACSGAPILPQGVCYYIVKDDVIMTIVDEINSRLPYKLKVYLGALTVLVVAIAALTILNTINRAVVIDANTVSIRQDSGLIQWKTPNKKWQTLISVDQLTGGIDGHDGTKGDTGANGVNGSQGANGTPGADGVVGSNGLSGADGQNGSDGANGTAGAQGSTGVAGAAGANGTNGTNGAQGQAGVNGVDGTNGTNGTDGATGSQGSAGVNGVNGIDGREIELQKGTLYIQWRYVGTATWNNIIAYSDLKGDKGDTGETGLTGANGTQGIQGIQGIQGAQGQDGLNGIGNSIEPKEVSVVTAAATAAKIGTTTEGTYAPTKGNMILLTLSVANTASNPTLNVDGSGVKSILIGNVAPSNIAMAGTKVLLWYDGTAYQLFGSQRASDSAGATYTGITGSTATTTTATSTLAINNFTIANYAAGKLLFTLPTSAAVGSVVEVYSASAGGYRITSGASAIILYPDGTSSGAAGWIETTQYGTITLRCVVANTTWMVTNNSKLITNNNGVNYN